MRSGFITAELMKGRLRPVPLAIVGLMALIVAGDHAGAAGGRAGRAVEFIESRAAGEPIIAVVSLRSQRITVYDAEGWIFRAPVSSGQKGRETPAGIFSIIQKNAEHYSNLYDDAYMPHMQRLTWSGIALHGGALPGYPASHGCVRLPFDFAARLFDATRMGTRVILAPGDAAPVEIAHPALFAPKPGAAALAAARAAEANEATRKADQARLVVVTALREAARAGVPVRIAENLRLRAEEQLAAAEVAISSATSAESKAQAEEAKANAVARIAELQAQWAAARAELQPKLDAVAPVRDAAVAAEAARVAAAQAAREVALDLEPVSVFISRKTQRLYVRRGFEPVLESEVTILHPDRPIGTHVFTGMERIKGDASLRWTVVSLDDGSPRGAAELRSRVRGGPAQDMRLISTGPSGAETALERIVIPQDALERISGMVSPRSSLIISDEAFSPETAKGTDFIVVLSGEPQGSLKIRRRGRMAEGRY
jgi:hypothetical protein